MKDFAPMKESIPPAAWVFSQGNWRSRYRSRHTIVLSGGEGTRMRPFIRQWLGEDRPKQYCAFVGTRTMLQHSLDRAADLVDPGHTHLVLGPQHQRYLGHGLPGFAGRLHSQPANRGTAVGIFLALAEILEADPEATVLVLPSDQFIHPEAAFRRYADRAFLLAEQFRDHVVLMGVAATEPERDYGWIEPAEQVLGANWEADLRPPSRVRRFVEKPSANLAELLLQRRALWNTMSLVARAETLWKMGRRFLPRLVRRFDEYRLMRRALGADARRLEAAALLTRIYEQPGQIDFCQAILQSDPQSCLVLPMDDLHWSDWGRPERIEDTILRFGIRPNIPLALPETRGVDIHEYAIG